MDYQTLIKLCKKYDIEYKNHYGIIKSYIRLKRKVEQHQHLINKKRKQDIDETGTQTEYYFIGD